MNLGIYTIEKTLYEGQVKQIVAKTTTGEITVLPDHIPLITELVVAPLRLIEKDGTEKSITLSGFMEIQPESNVVILANGK